MSYIPDITQRYPDGFGGPYMSESEIKWAEQRQKNKERIEKARQDGNLMWFADDCVGCKHYEAIGPTSTIDDVEHGICHRMDIKDCNYRKEHWQ